jgi:hypothetical protein
MNPCLKPKHNTKMETQTKVVASSFPVTGLLGCIFVTLKLLGFINWSWLWVTAPFWGPPALVVAILLAILGGAVIAFVLKSLLK